VQSVVQPKWKTHRPTAGAMAMALREGTQDPLLAHHADVIAKADGEAK